MSKFLTGPALEKEICNIILDAEHTLLIVCPFIKLDAFFVEHFKRQSNNSHLHLLIVFGKNEYDKSRSLNQNDFEFFKKFPNVSIVYVANLHAKYYGNESKGVITSINMYDHSFKNNIEFGVFSEISLIDKFKQSTDQDAWIECRRIADEGEPVFVKRPVFKKKLLFGKDYINSTVLLDNTEAFFNPHYYKKADKRKLTEFAEEIDFAEQPAKEIVREDFQQKGQSKYIPNSTNHNRNNSYQNNNTGYCIRTGVQIPFNPSRPFSTEGYRSWAQYENWDYKENFCHKTGNESRGRTSMRNPILN